MKKIFFALLALVMTTMTASARVGQPTGDCYWYIDGSTKTLTISGNGAMDDYAEATETPWYAQRKDIQKVIVEEGVTNIGDRAFHSLENLSFVNIAQTVQTIGKYAFRGCHSLEFVTIPAAVTTIDLDAFYQCTSIKDVFMYADPTTLTWKDTDCDDFMGLKKTVCHVSGDAEAWTSAFGKTINVTPQETTGIAALSQEKAATVYDLQGRRIKGNAKGVVIKGGKKTLVK